MAAEADGGCIEISGCDVPWISSGGVHDVEMASFTVAPLIPVAVEKPVDDSKGSLILSHFMSDLGARVQGRGLRVDFCRKGEIFTVGRPDKILHTRRNVGYFLRLTAVRGDSIDLRTSFSRGDEGEQGTVRTPTGIAVVCGMGC